MRLSRHGLSDPAKPRAFVPEGILLSLAIVWGGTFLATHTVLREVGPGTLVAYRFALGVLTLSFFARGRTTREEWRAGIGIGLAMAVTFGGQTVGLRTVDSSLSAFLTAAGVPLVPLLQAKLLRRRVEKKVWAAALAAASGVALLGWRAGVHGGFGIGEALTLVSAGGGALHVVLLGRYAERCDPFRFTRVQLGTVAVLALPFSLFEPHPVPSALSVGLATGLGVIATGAVLGAMTWAQRFVEPARAVLIYALEPVFAAILGVWAGERIGLGSWAGAALVVSAAVVGEWPARRPPLPDSAIGG